MSDNLEEILKQAVRKIIAEAMVEAAGQPMSAGQSAIACAPPVMPVQGATRVFSIWCEKLTFVSKSAACVAFAACACAAIGIGLFAPELAQAAIGGELSGHQYYSLPIAADNNHPERRVEEVSWKDLARMDKVEEMLKKGAILHASPEDLSAIVIFFFLRKMAKGERIDINSLQRDFRDSLPEEWMPVYNTIVEEYPEHEFAPQTAWFAPPRI